MFETIEHTADVGIRVSGDSLEALFVDAARGMFSLIGKVEGSDDAVGKGVDVEAPDVTNLLVRWLSELLYLFESEKLFFTRFSVEHLTETKLRAQAFGQRVTPTSGEVETEIKAVTYHNLKVERDGDGWKTEIIFDV